ncbi:MAG: hypothetical protein EXR72_23715 [Myxococcales bacterium]|nr:hypothetical protein [Myxococcales bacterium]
MGRRRELDAASQLLTGQAGGRSLLVRGRAGVGKTRLIDELLPVAAARGHRCLRFGPDPTGVAESWRPVRQAVAARLGVSFPTGLPELRRGAEASGLAAGDVRPGLAELFRIGGRGELEPAVRRRECDSAALRALRGRPSSPPTVLVFEDVEAYDRPLLALVSRLLLTPGDGKLVVIATTSDHPRTARLQAGEVIALAPLTGDELCDLVDAILGSSPGADRLAVCLAVADGLPLHVEQIVRVIVDGGTPSGGGLCALLSARIDGLPPDARRALQAAAVIGGEAPRDLIAQLMRPGDDVDAALATLTRRGMIAFADGVARIGHALLAQVTYDGIPAEARRQLHAQLALLLAGSSVGPAVLGRHASRAGGSGDAVELFQQAGDARHAALDDHGAAACYQAALDLARAAFVRGEESDGTRLARIGACRGEALLRSGDGALAETVLREAFERAGKDPETTALVLRGLGRLLHSTGDDEQAYQVLRGALAHASSSGNLPLCAELSLEIGGLLQRRGDPGGALQHLREALLACGLGGRGLPGGSPLSGWRIALAIAQIHAALGRSDPARRQALGALRQAERAGSVAGQARAHEQLADFECAVGRRADAAPHRLAAIALLRREGDRRAVARLLIDAASDEVATGPQGRARAWRGEARSLAAAVEWEGGVRRCDEALRQRPGG